MPCPDENTVAELFDGLLAAVERQQVEDHIDTCPRCRGVLAALSGAITDPGADDDAGLAPPAVSRPTAPSVDRGPGLLRGDSVGRYAVLECLGAGSMGVVYAAYDPHLDRRVALKLLHGADDPLLRDRPFREAKSMARLTHPNIVGVHDVGRHGDHVFIAMEFVEGTTLTRWLSDKERSVAEVVEVFSAAGEGLVAAHAAGVVHRDFKPDNVMVAGDGRVCVADFGLAAVRATVSGLVSGGNAEPLATSVAGTPRYMAPEQAQGAPPAPASDQFSFCVALYEAVYREFPYEGADAETLAEAKAAGCVRPQRIGASVPASVRRAIERGLLADPDERHPDMRAVLDAMRGSKGHRGWVALGAAAAAALGVGFVLAADDPAQCPAVDVASAWDATRRAEVAEAIISTPAPYAEQISRGVIDNLDRHAAAWTAMHQEICEAARVRQTQSEAVMELRMQCLEARRVELAALTDVLRGIEDVGIDRAIDATARLSPIEDCRDLERLRDRHERDEGRVEPPPDRVEALARIKALVDAGDFASAKTLADDTAVRSEQGGDAHSAARALIARAWAEAHLQPGARPEQTLHRALDLAETADADELRARAMTLLVFAVGYAQARYAEGTRWGEHASALVERIDASPGLRAQLLRYRGLVAHEQGRFADAEAFHRRAVDTLSTAGLDGHPAFGQCIAALANALRSQRHFAQAQAFFERGLAIELQTLGPWHPRVANATHGLGNVLKEQGEHRAAREHYRRALRIHEAVYGRMHADVAGDLHALGDVARVLGELDAAEAALGEALQIHDALTDGPHPRRAGILASRARLRLAQGDLDASLRDSQAALVSMREAAPGHPDIAVFENNLGISLLGLERFEDARTHFERSVEAARLALGPSHPMVGVAMTGVGRAQVRLQHYAEAIESLEGALRVWGDGEVLPRHRFDARLGLAQALWASDRERGRARSLVRLAVDEFAAHDDPDPQRLAEARAWLESRP